MSRRPRGRPPYDDILTPAEWRVLHAAQHGMLNKEIARRMGISQDAIKYHLRNLREKLGIANKQDLAKVFHVPKASNLQQQREESDMTESISFASIGQISRTVSDVNAAANWFEVVLEVPHLYTFGSLAFFDCGGTRLMLTEEEQLNKNESLLYFKVTNIEKAYSTLQEKGVEFINAPHKVHQHEDGSEEWMAFFKDPDDRPLAIMATMEP